MNSLRNDHKDTVINMSIPIRHVHVQSVYSKCDDACIPIQILKSYMHKYIYIYIYIYIIIYIYIYLYIYIYIYILFYTYTHIYILYTYLCVFGLTGILYS